MKQLATILLLTAFCNSLFVYSYFSISLLAAKVDAQLSLAKVNGNVFGDIRKVPVCLLQKDESDEVWYDGKLYDVVERDRINDTLFVFLLWDEQEQTVLAGNERYLQDTLGELLVGGNKVTSAKSAVTITDTEQMLKYQRMLSGYDCLFKLQPAANKSPLSAICTETPSPPPRRA